MLLRSLRYVVLALLVMGSASLLFSCDTKPQVTTYDYETLMTESSENRVITMMENGKRSYTFVSPLMEGYSLASNPYQEFRRGISMTTYTDSLSLQDATITANYAIYYERQRLWEAKGNVVIIKRNRQDGDTAVVNLTEIYTQQLFWNATTKKIYSNVDTKVLQPDGWHFGVGFDADDDLKNIHFRRYSSEVEFDMSQPEPSASEESKEESKDSGNSEVKASPVTEGNEHKATSSDKKSGVATDKSAKSVSSPVERTAISPDRNFSPMTSGSASLSDRSDDAKPAAATTQPVKSVTPSMGMTPERVATDGNPTIQSISSVQAAPANVPQAMPRATSQVVIESEAVNSAAINSAAINSEETK